MTLVDAPESPQPAATTEAPAPSSAPSAPEDTRPDAAESGAPEATQDASTTGTPNLRDVWKGLSPQEREEYLRETPWEETFGASDWLKGKVGAQKQQTEREQRAERERIAAEVRADILREAEERRRVELAESDDLVGLGELEKQRILGQRAEQAKQLDRQHWDRALQYETQVTINAAVATIAEALPNGKSLLVNEQGTRRQYAPEGTVADGLREFIEAAAEARLADRLPALRKEIEAAVRTELHADRLGGEPSPDTRVGTPPAGAVTKAEYDAHKGSADWIRANRARITPYLQSLMAT